MPKHEELKKRLLAYYEKSLDKMLSSLPEAETLRLSDLERASGELGSELMQDILQNLASEEQIESKKQVVCPDCGGKSYRRGKRTKQVISSRGEFELERQYYVCSQCGHGFFPLDQHWGLNETAYSPEMAGQMTWLSALLPYEQCQAVFWEISGRLIPSSSIWRQRQVYGEKLWNYSQKQAEQVRPSLWPVLLCHPTGQRFRSQCYSFRNKSSSMLVSAVVLADTRFEANSSSMLSR